MPEPILSLGVISAVLVSAVVQRVSGFGFGLVLAPPLVVLLGSHQGVMLANFLSIIAPLFIMPRVWRDIDWRRFRMLALPALLVIPIAAWFSTLTPPGFLDIIVALMIIVGLICTVHIASTTRQVDGAVTVTLTGIGAGIGTAVAGVGAPCHDDLCRSLRLGHPCDGRYPSATLAVALGHGLPHQIRHGSRTRPRPSMADMVLLRPRDPRRDPPRRTNSEQSG